MINFLNSEMSNLSAILDKDTPRPQPLLALVPPVRAPLDYHALPHYWNKSGLKLNLPAENTRKSRTCQSPMAPRHYVPRRLTASYHSRDIKLALSSTAEVGGLVAGCERGRARVEECVRGGRKAGDERGGGHTC